MSTALSPSIDVSTALLLLSLALWAVFALPGNHTQSLPLPPGPRPKWLIGNLLDMPTGSGWIPFTELKKHFDVFCLRALGKTIIVLNTQESIAELLDRRATNFSDRPVLPMAGDLMGLHKSTSLLQYDASWKKRRMLSKPALNPDSVTKYTDILDQVMVLLLKSLLEHPEHFSEHIRLAMSRVIMTVTYGLSVKTADQDYITENEAVFDKINRYLVPGRYLVDLIPALKYIPVWFPFANFQREALEGRRQLQSVVDRPYEHVKRDLASGKAAPSFVSDLLTNHDEESHGPLDAQAEDTIKWAAGTLYGAGAETTYGTVMVFILAMAKFPAVQAKAQAEIDNLTGGDRLPDITDLNSLPYVNAVIKETLRWYPILPLGFPRVSRDGDVYKGYRIPAGSLVLPNVWGVTQDECLYPSPQQFLPERFLNKNLDTSPLDPYSYAFGFGRRVCPGRHLADNMLFLFISSILATFTIAKKRDHDGNEIPVAPAFGTGLISLPDSFPCSITPRSEKARNIVMNRSFAI